MATVLIDKLLQAAVKQGVSDIHIVVGQPPVFRLHGRMRKLETKTLEAEDSVALMKALRPSDASENYKKPAAPTLDLRSANLHDFECRCSSSAASSRWCCGRFQ